MDSIRLEVQEEDYPAYLGDALTFIMSNLENAFQLNDVAAAARVSERTLHLAFRANFALPVMAFVRYRRLELAHRQLLGADESSVSVTAVAMNCGFQHLGRFSAAYRQYFNELPSDTLRRRKTDAAGNSSTLAQPAARLEGLTPTTSCTCCTGVPSNDCEKLKSGGVERPRAA